MADAPGVEAWSEETDAFDRARSVATTMSQPRTASYIAEEAHVEEGVAQKHLGQLVDVGVLLQSGDEEEPVYAPDPLYERMVALRDLLDEYDRAGLAELRSELEEEMETLDRQERDLAGHRLGLVEEAMGVCDRYTFGQNLDQ